MRIGECSIQADLAAVLTELFAWTRHNRIYRQGAVSRGDPELPAGHA